jgi:methionyl-tRNA synthetase
VVFGQDGDFSWELFEKSYNAALANNLGNLVNRLTTMAHRYRDGRLTGTDAASVERRVVVEKCVPEYRKAMESLHLSGATVWAFSVVDAANEMIAKGEPWKLAKAQDPLLHSVLATLHEACLKLAEELSPFLPSAAARIITQCTPIDGVLPPATPLFPRLT